MNNLIRLVGRRLVLLPIMVLGVTFLVFVLMSLSPIDPAYAALGESATPEALAAYRETNGLNDPWYIQFGSYIAGMVQGDLGVYGQAGLPVADKVFAALPITLQLTFFGLIIAILISFPLGIIAALFRNRWPDQVIRFFSVIFIATPSFWLAICWSWHSSASCLSPVACRSLAKTPSAGLSACCFQQSPWRYR